MFHLKPLNKAAEDALDQQRAIFQSRSGLVVQEGRQAYWKRSFVPAVGRASGGDIMTPSGTRRVVIGFDGNAPLTNTEVRTLLSNPASGYFPVFDVTPKSGKFLERVSQVAFALGLVYLATGALVGVAMPAWLHYSSLFYGGGYSTATTGKIRKYISDTAVFKEPTIDERTKKFFDAIKAIKAEAKKEQVK
ncbi:hypothetical protein HFN89_05430 [Rhizobium laguerreae]|nr:hypothetical protein [Rhizobium laguerreae]